MIFLILTGDDFEEWCFKMSQQIGKKALDTIPAHPHFRPFFAGYFSSEDFSDPVTLFQGFGIVAREKPLKKYFSPRMFRKTFPEGDVEYSNASALNP